MRELFFLAALSFACFGFLLTLKGPGMAMPKGSDIMSKKPEGYPVATLAGGCFWCLESELRALDGILYTRAGYTGGDTQNPTYEQVTTGKTGHAEAVEVTFDPEKISYADLVEFFLTKAHDPTQLNRQGVDVGPQYRSAIFYHGEEQKRIAEEVKRNVAADGPYKNQIVTEIAPAGPFWEAESYHQQYYEKYEKQSGRQHLRVLLKQKNKEAAQGTQN